MIAYLVDGEPLPYAVSVIVSGSNAVALEGALILSHCSTSSWASATRNRSSLSQIAGHAGIPRLPGRVFAAQYPAYAYPCQRFAPALTNDDA